MDPSLQNAVPMRKYVRGGFWPAEILGQRTLLPSGGGLCFAEAVCLAENFGLRQLIGQPTEAKVKRTSSLR